MWIFIVTYARSGSTLLQGLLNTSSDIHVTGENGNFLYKIYEAWDAIERHKVIAGRNVKRTSVHPFYGIDWMSSEIFDRHIRALARELIMASCPKEKTPLSLGFKEIRYPYVDDLKGYLLFLAKCFDSSTFIFLTRALHDVSNSVLFDNLTDSERAALVESFARFERDCIQVAKKLSNSIFLDYNDLVSDQSALVSKLNECGIKLDEDAVAAALEIPHSYATTARADDRTC